MAVHATDVERQQRQLTICRTLLRKATDIIGEEVAPELSRERQKVYARLSDAEYLLAIVEEELAKLD